MQPPNDNFASATVIPTTFPYTNTVPDFDEATDEGGSEPLDCFSDTISIWYSLTPAANAVLTLNTVGSTFDSVLGVYTGASLATLTMQRCNDDFDTSDDAGFASTITGMSLTGGTTYYIRIGAFDNGLLLPGDSATLNVFVTPAAGAFTVNSTADAVDVNIGDGACLTAGSVCTLRAAINEANASQPGSTITLPAGTYTITIDAPPDPGNPAQQLFEDAAVNGDLDVVSGVTITGAGAQTTIVDGGDIDTVFDFFAGANVTLTGVTVRNGNRSGNQSAGGGLRINETASVTANNVWITSNEAVFGGGLTVEGGTFTMTNGAITGNTATGRTFDNDPNPDTYIAGNGGGLEVRESLGVDATISLTNVTISGNTAVAPDASVTSKGGGVYLGAPVASLTVTFNNVTIAANTANRGGGIESNMPGADIDTLNTLIGDNTAATNPDCKGNIGSDGSNFVESSSGCNTHASDTLDQSPFLDPLILNVPGSTPTHLIRNASPARENGTPGTCAATDQRGITRPQGTICDIGAFEGSTATPGAFAPIAPANSAVFTSSTEITQLTWSPSANAIAYTITIENISTGTPVVVFTQTVSSAVCGGTCAVAFSTPLSDGFYRYSLVATADTASTPASAMHLFQIDSIAALPNLIANGGFETAGKNGQPANWKFSLLSGDKRKCNTLEVTVAYEGVCAYMFKGSNSEATVLKQKVNKTGLTLAAGDEFRLTFFANPGTVMNATAQLKVTYTKSSIPVTKLKLTIPVGDASFKPFTGDVELTDHRVEKIMVIFTNKSKKGKWYVDAVKVVYIAGGIRQFGASTLLPPPAAPGGFRGQN